MQENGEDYAWVGSSSLAPDEIADTLARGEYFRLEDLLYMHEYQVKSFEEWDPTLVPTRWINPRYVKSFMQFCGDPRTMEHKRPADLTADADGGEPDAGSSSWLPRWTRRGE